MSYTNHTPITGYAFLLLSNRGRFPYRAGMEPPLPLPRRVAWFAPWRWRRRTRWMAAGLAMLAYPLSSPIMIYTIWKLDETFPDLGIAAVLGEVHYVAYAPVIFLTAHCPPFAWLHRAELTLLLTVFGVPNE